MGNGESQVEEEEEMLYQHGYQILKVQPNGPCDGKKIKIFFEFIVGVNGQAVDITNVDSFLDLLRKNASKPLRLTVLDCKARHIREIDTVPSREKQHLGINIRLCSTKLATSMVWHILQVFPNSPASMAGLETNNDYIIGTPSFIFSDDEDLFNLISSSVGKPSNFFVYNRLRDDVRTVTITPNDNWGGAGCLGCDVGYGALHKLPGISTKPYTIDPDVTLFSQPQQPPSMSEDQENETEKEKEKEKEKEEDEGGVKITDLKEEEQEMLPPLAAPPSEPLSSSPISLPISSSPLLTEIDLSSPNPLPTVSPIPHQRAPTSEPIKLTPIIEEQQQQPEQQEEPKQPEKQQQQQQQHQQPAPQLLQPAAQPPSKKGYDFSVDDSPFFSPTTPSLSATTTTPTLLTERLCSSVPLSSATPPPLLSVPITAPTPITPPSTPTKPSHSNIPDLETLQKKKKELEARLANIKKSGRGGGGLVQNRK